MPLAMESMELSLSAFDCWYLCCHSSSSLAMALLHAIDMQAAEVLEHAPVPQAFLGQLDDGGRDGQLDQLAVLVRRPDEGRLAVALFLAQLDVLVPPAAGLRFRWPGGSAS